MTEINSVATNIQNIMMLQGASRNMPMNIPNEQQSIKGVSKNMPFNYEPTREIYYNYNSKGERVMIRQVGNMVDLMVL